MKERRGGGWGGRRKCIARGNGHFPCAWLKLLPSTRVEFMIQVWRKLEGELMHVHVAISNC